LGRRSRQRERAPVTAEAPARPSRSEARNAEARAALEPLAPGERPTPVTVAAVVAAALALGQVIAFAAGATIDGKQPKAFGIVAFALLMLTAAWGMWHARYWAVLGFQALLAITIIIAALSLAVASSAAAAVFCVAIVTLGGWLFWKLIRSMARIQMPERPGR
jgi:cation transport ATPase